MSINHTSPAQDELIPKHLKVHLIHQSLSRNCTVCNTSTNFNARHDGAIKRMNSGGVHHRGTKGDWGVKANPEVGKDCQNLDAAV